MKRKTGTESGKAETRNDVMHNLHMRTALSHLIISTSAMHINFLQYILYTDVYSFTLL